MTRAFWVVAHRWAGLTIAFFLVVAGSTGALLAWNEELTDLTAPWHVVQPPAAAARMLDPLTLNAAALRAAPAGYRLEGLRLNAQPDRVLEIGLEPPEGGAAPPISVAVDPYTAGVVKITPYNTLPRGWDEAMGFVYQLHYKLALGPAGLRAFGLAALVWTLDCFVGFYLTLPPAMAGWWRRWRKSWRVRLPPSSCYRLHFDLHRAGGLWLWPVLLVFAWSSVGMNLRAEVYDPVMRAAGVENPYETLPPRPAPPGYTPDWSAAYALGRTLAAREGARLGFTVVHEHALFFDAERSAYSYNFRSSRDFTDKGGWSSVLFYADGAPARTIIADGGLDEGSADNWLMALHMAQVGGLPYRIFVTMLGLLVTMLSVTGVLVWTRKRSARLLHERRTAAPERPPSPLVPAGFAERSLRTP